MPAPPTPLGRAGEDSIVRVCIVVMSLAVLLLYLVYNLLINVQSPLKPISPTSLASLTSTVMLMFAWATLVLASIYYRA